MPDLKIPPDEAIRLLTERIDAMQSVKRTGNGLDYYDFVGWCSKTWRAIDGIYEAGDPHPEEIRTIGLQNCSCNSHTGALVLAEVYHSKLLDYITEIRDSL